MPAPEDHLRPLREAPDEALALWEGRPDTVGVFTGVSLRLDEWRRVPDALEKS